jgi:hypothetical protein
VLLSGYWATLVLKSRSGDDFVLVGEAEIYVMFPVEHLIAGSLTGGRGANAPKMDLWSRINIPCRTLPVSPSDVNFSSGGMQ